MLVLKTIKDLQGNLQHIRESGSVGFVPTMGALHQGHISLVERALEDNEVVVVSIFVNPTQFNDQADLKRYPRNPDSDLRLLETTGCHLVFVPEAIEIYPEPDTRKFDFGALGSVMEGKHRQGHFNGVAQVVSRLFDIVKPNKVYFGQKDFQQLAIIKKMVKQLELPVEIISCPIIREENGLAMSSRNSLLTEEERKNAAVISGTLFGAQKLVGQKSVQEVTDWVIETINKNPFLTVEYFEIVDGEQLQPVRSWEEDKVMMGCVAVYCGKIRLIDNVILN